MHVCFRLSPENDSTEAEIKEAAIAPNTQLSAFALQAGLFICVWGWKGQKGRKIRGMEGTEC